MALVDLIVRLGDQSADVRVGAIEKLVQVGDPAVESLIRALGDTSNEMRRCSAAESVGEIKDYRALEALIRALQDSSHYVRIEAAIALGEMKDPKAVKPLVEVLRDPELRVIQFAADALGQIGDSSAVDGLLEALSRRPRLPNLIAALAKIGSPGIQAIAARLRDPDEQVRMCSAYQLKNITDYLPEVSRDADVISGLVAALEDTFPIVRAEAAGALGFFSGDPETIDAVRKLLDDPDKNVRAGAKWALENWNR